MSPAHCLLSLVETHPLPGDSCHVLSEASVAGLQWASGVLGKLHSPPRMGGTSVDAL